MKLHVSTAIAVVTLDCNNTWNSYFKTERLLSTATYPGLRVNERLSLNKSRK